MKTIIEQIIKKQLRQLWEAELRDAALKCPASDYLSYDLHQNYPSFVFVAADIEQMREIVMRNFENRHGDIKAEVDFKPTIINQDLSPEEELKNLMRFRPIPAERFAFLTKEVKHNGGSREATDVVWHVIRPGFKMIVRDYLSRRRPDCEVLNGVQGWIIPLCARSLFEEAPDLNEYMHNLMFWESVMTMDDFGPLVQRYAWLLNSSLELANNEEQLKMKIWSLYPETRNVKMDNVLRAFDVAMKKKQESEKEQERLTIIKDIVASERQQKIQDMMQMLKTVQADIYQATQERAQAEAMVVQYRDKIDQQTSHMAKLQSLYADLQKQIENLMKEDNHDN